MRKERLTSYEMEQELGQGWSDEGVAMLCFDSSSSAFQGRLVTPTGKQYGLMGKSCGPPPDTHFHQCCFDEDPVFFKITVIDYKRRSETLLDYIMKTNGDNCSLTSDNLEFSTDELLTDEKADDVIKRFFDKSLLGKDCLVCVGQWKMQVNFPCPEKKDEGDDSDF
ncbi:uncharacterized protein LOC110981953 [Acanthaster planci]|uniref:Uncharacterized protein LOC110981953 n=1 Tax=Acanthaster planci TaxID=133434 RepID=A0A8B7YWN9_ACAPL|nr:uncharacterized protein LOC110981953 [Acanthaster planci]XP_022095705.1 uncharacterized protein LOC110981953 [Acanthaster planci]XP_022095706.1 uncharacterized protein LOC110981953 [Acanthaster planci]